MFTVSRYTFTRLRGQILGWGLSVAALGLMIVGFYGIFQERQAEFRKLIEGYPPEMLAFLGGDAVSLFTPEGFLGMYGLSMLPVIVGIFAVIAGSGLLAADEEGGRLDLVLAHPMSRSALLWGRVLGFAAATLAILVLGWLGFCVLLGVSELGITWGQVALPFLSLWAQVLVYGLLALLLALLLPARRLAATAAGLVMAASYFISGMASLDEKLASVAKLLPYAYFQGGDAIHNFNPAWFAGVLAVSALLALLAWWRFERRDIRVSGEGSWRLPRLWSAKG
jgi:ABC-2 type transport system permease protein